MGQIDEDHAQQIVETITHRQSKLSDQHRKSHGGLGVSQLLGEILKDEKKLHSKPATTVKNGYIMGEKERENLGRDKDINIKGELANELKKKTLKDNNKGKKIEKEKIKREKCHKSQKSHKQKSKHKHNKNHTIQDEGAPLIASETKDQVEEIITPEESKNTNREEKVKDNTNAERVEVPIQTIKDPSITIQSKGEKNINLTQCAPHIQLQESPQTKSDILEHVLSLYIYIYIYI